MAAFPVFGDSSFYGNLGACANNCFQTLMFTAAHPLFPDPISGTHLVVRELREEETL